MSSLQLARTRLGPVLPSPMVQEASSGSRQVLAKGSTAPAENTLFQLSPAVPHLTLCLLSFLVPYLMQGDVFPSEPGGTGVCRGRSIWACSPQPSPPPMAQAVFPPQPFGFHSHLQFLSAVSPGTSGRKVGHALRFLADHICAFHQHCSQSLPCFIEENVVPFIAAKKCSSKLSSTHIFRLIELLN